MSKEAYISFDTAKLAKEKGFTFDGGFGYLGKDGKYCQNNNKFWRKLDDFYPSCTQSLLARWLREKYNIWIQIIYLYPYSFEMYVCYIGSDEKCSFPDTETKIFTTYEEAMENGLLNALELINNNE